jgi:hypothetical protein
MQYHSNDYSVSVDEFKRMYGQAAAGATQLLIVSPGPIKNLETQFSRAFGAEAWGLIYLHRQLVIPNSGLTVYFEATGTTRKFTKGNVYLPYAGMHTVNEYVSDNRSVNTFFLPQSQSDLSQYLIKYPNSIAV